MTTDQPRRDPLPLPHGRSVAIACSIRCQWRPHQQHAVGTPQTTPTGNLRTTQRRFTVTSTQRVTQGRTRLIPAEAITAYVELLTAEADRVR